MPEHPMRNLVLEDVKLVFRNFAGMERDYNSEGDRNFSVILDPDRAQQLIEQGWRVKKLKDKEIDGEVIPGDYHLKVKLNYKKGRPPRVVLVTSNRRTDLGEDEVGMIDALDIKTVDLVVNGWWSDMAGGGYSGFLKDAFVTIEESPLDLKYANLQSANEDLMDVDD